MTDPHLLLLLLLPIHDRGLLVKKPAGGLPDFAAAVASGQRPAEAILPGSGKVGCQAWPAICHKKVK